MRAPVEELGSGEPDGASEPAGAGDPVGPGDPDRVSDVEAPHAATREAERTTRKRASVRLTGMESPGRRLSLPAPTPDLALRFRIGSRRGSLPER
jgi:hypothetical protein